MLSSSVFLFHQFLKTSLLSIPTFPDVVVLMIVLFGLNGGCNSCSRSQCIINIRCGSKQGGEEVDDNASSTTLTIVDLAGAEREKKTGNQVLFQSRNSIQLLCLCKQLGYKRVK